jgi:Flp pilus assembly protein TadD
MLVSARYQKRKGTDELHRNAPVLLSLHKAIKMNSAISKRLAALAVVSLSVVAGGCATGAPGYGQARDGNYAAADASFTREYRSNPNNSIVQFNMADTYMRRGNTAAANSLYRDAAASGKGVVPTNLLEEHPRGTTIAEAACEHLRQNGVSDANCPI